MCVISSGLLCNFLMYDAFKKGTYKSTFGLKNVLESLLSYFLFVIFIFNLMFFVEKIYLPF